VHRSTSPSAGREAPRPQPLTAVGIIPARLHSTRLPEKPLQDLGGAPLIARVLERVLRSPSFHAVIVATDSERIADAVRAAGGQAVITSESCPSGLDRVAEAARDTEEDVIVNIQGDEPFVSTSGLDHLVSLFRHPNIVMGTLAAPFPAHEDLADPNRVKVVVDRMGRALYFSRSPIPHRVAEAGRAPGEDAGHASLLHVGVYAYRREALFELARLGPCPLERTERLEQLRALWNGIPIHVAVGEYASLGIDTPEDLDRARRLFRDGREP
jgi:3-deoxy-manno-octulosonate cytidylyltransferase (CMP-KDO synthetase)